MQTLGGVGLPEVMAGATIVALNAYLLTGGADYGGGVWDLLASGPRREEQRRLITHAIGPIWAANQVWLIVASVLLFTGFPPAFAAIGTFLHIPLTLLLVGIVLRGSAFVFRTYGSRESDERHRWGRLFAIASVITPIFLGISLGALASGAIGARVGAGDVRPVLGSYVDTYVRTWFAPFPLATGAMALAVFAFLAATYLTLEAREPALREDFRRRALAAAAAVFGTAGIALLIAYLGALRVGSGLTTARWAVPFQVVTGIVALVAWWALWTRRWSFARIAAATQASLILWGWAMAQYPFVVPQAITIRQAAAPAITMEILLWTLVVGGAVLAPSLVFLFRTFTRTRAR